MSEPNRVLTPRALPLPELQAARLDGDVYAVDGCFASLAEPDLPAVRAAAVAWLVPDDRLVAERLTAAWIWGALHAPPSRHQFSAAGGSRQGPVAAFVVRQTHLTPADVEIVGPLRVTTPLRTLVDLLLTAGPLSVDERAALRSLGVPADLGPIRSMLTSRPQLPHGRQALRRIRALLGERESAGAQPALTR